MADTNSGVGPEDTGTAQTGIIGETGADVISGDITDPSGEMGRDIDADPDVAPIQGGDISETPAAQSGTRGSGTGADAGTGGEIGTTHPGQVGTTQGS